MPGFLIDHKALYEALDERRKQQGASWRQIGADLDIPATTFTRIKNGNGVSVHTFFTLMIWMGINVQEPLGPFLVAAGDELYS